MNTEYESGEGLSILVGKKIAKIYLSKDDVYLKIECDDGHAYYFYCSPDCCSKSWIEHIHINIWFSENARAITEVKNTSMKAIMPTFQEFDKLYSSCCYVDNELVFGVEFRNSSNGYYGSMLDHVTFKDDEKSLAEIVWREITESC